MASSFDESIFKIGSQVLNVEPTWLKIEPWDERREDILIQPWMIFVVIGISKRPDKIKGIPVAGNVSYEVIDYRLRRGWISEKDLIKA